MKKFAQLTALVLAALMLLCACQPSAPAATGAPATDAPATSVPATDAPSASPTDAPTAQPVSVFHPEPGQMGNDYYSYFTEDITYLNWLQSSYSIDAEAFAKTLDPLVLVDNYGNFQPGLAESWTHDGVKWTFKLREGVQWYKSDGTAYAEVTAQDFVDAAEMILNPALGSETVWFWQSFIEGADAYYTALSEGGTPDLATVGVKALDTYTVEYTTAADYAFFPSLVTYSAFLPLCKAFVEEVGGMESFGTSVDTFLQYSEYLFTQWDKGQLWRFEKNPNYYFADRVHTGVLEFVFVADPAVVLEMYQRGELSAAAITADKLDLARATPELAPYIYRTSLTSSTYSWCWQVNTAPTPESENLRPALNNRNFRKAVFSAINRTAVLSVSNSLEPEILRRNTVTFKGMCVDENGAEYIANYGNLAQYDDESFDYYNPDEAKRLFALAKEELGDTVQWPVHILYLNLNSESAVRVANLLKQSVEETLGTENVIIDFTDSPSDAYYATSEAGAYDLAYPGWTPDYGDPQSGLEVYMTDNYFGSKAQFALLNDALEFDAMMREGIEKTVLSERFQEFAEAEEYLIESALIMPFRSIGGNYAINSIQNPYDTMSAVPYGLCNEMWKDRFFGDTPLTVEQRDAARAEYEASRP